MPEEYYYQALTNVKDYRLTFPDYVQSVSLTQNDLGNFADITASGKGIGMNIQMGYSSDPTAKTFSADVTKGDYTGSTLTTSLEKTWSFDGKNPTGATKIHAELKLHYGFLSPLFLIGDESIKFGLQQALDKIGDRAKVLQQSSGNAPIVSVSPTPTKTNPPVTTSTPSITNTQKPTPTITQPITPPITQPTQPIIQPTQPNPTITKPSTSSKLPTITLYSSSVSGMSATIYGNAQSGSGNPIINISWDWGDGQTSFGKFPQTHTYAQSGTYTVTATVTDGGLSSSATTSVVISSPQPQSNTPQTEPTVSPEATVTTDKTSYSSGDIIYFSGTVMTSDSSYVTVVINDPNNKFVLLTSGIADNNHRFQIMVDTNSQDNKPKFSLKGTYSATAFTKTQSSGSTVSFDFSPQLQQSSATTITSTTYVVNPSTYTPIPFSLSCSASVTGIFSAYAGLGNNIDLFVFDQNNFQKYQNNNAYTYLYYNQRTGSGNFILNLNSGNYYIVLSNTYSVISQKNVNLQASYTCN